MKKNIQENLYKEIYRIREVGKKISQLYSEQEMRCPVHLSIGQEAVAVGICKNLRDFTYYSFNLMAHIRYYRTQESTEYTF